MLKNYITIAINNLIKNKLYSAINIAGLAIGLAACLVIALYVQDQYSYDKQWDNSDRIYRVNFTISRPSRPLMRFAITPLPAIPLLHEFFKDEIELSTRTVAVNKIVDAEMLQFEEKHVLVDLTFIDMFKLDVLAGNLETTLAEPGNIALSAAVAVRCFGNLDPVGKVITTKVSGVNVDYKVTAVYRFQGNTVLDIPMLSLLVDEYLPSFYNSWFNLNTSAYIKVKRDVNIDNLLPLTPAFINKNVDISGALPEPDLSASDVLKINFQKIETLHLDSPWDTSRAGGNKAIIFSVSTIAILILLIGCINFMILTTARATQRAKEVAIRKVVGAKRKQLIVQFLGESIFIVLLAMILSMGLVEILLPVFGLIMGKALTLDYISYFTFLPLLALLFIVGISGGLYPAVILSGFRPGEKFKGNQSKETTGSISLRTILVIFQFSVSIILIIATSVVYVQLHYIINRNPGYNRNNLLVINSILMHPELRDRLEIIKRELLNLSNVSGVGLSEIQPSQQLNNNRVFTHIGQPETSFLIAKIGIGYDYFSTYQIPLIAGRNFTVERDVPESVSGNMKPPAGSASIKRSENNIIINESAVRELGFSNAEEAIGKILNSIVLGNINYTIIGIVADNHIFSINTPPRSEVYLLEPDQANVITVRFKCSPETILKQVEFVWDKVMGDVQISHVFIDNLLVKEFEQEQTEKIILISFSILAILIACMGLFGSAVFTVERRTKEIGLRKVMGAKVKNIVSLFLWQFSKPVLIANIIAWPVAIFVMQYWLERFPYRFNPLLMIPICLSSGFIALVIAWFTVAGNTARVAKSKPIKALRYE